MMLSAAVAAPWTRDMPEQYASGEAAFRFLTLQVDSRVLIPRPETEGLVDLALEAARAAGRERGVAVDVGTGSGAIALALATEGSFDRVIGIDVSADALVVAGANRDRVAADAARRVEFRLGSYLAPVLHLEVDIVVSNPPYVAYNEAADLPASVRNWEPPIALFTGSQGLAATAAIVREAAGVLVPGGVLALEVDSRRAGQVLELLQADGRYRDGRIRRDLTDRDRYILAERR